MGLDILVVNWQDIKNPYAGGAEVNLHEIFGRLVKRGHRISLLASYFKGAKREEELNGINIYRYGSRNTFNYWVPWIYRKKFSLKKFDLIIEDLNKLPFFLSKFTTRPLGIIVHHLFDKIIYQEVSWPLATYVYLYERLLPKFYRGIPGIAVSYSTKEDLVKKGLNPDDIWVIYNGVDTERYYSSPLKSQNPLVVYLGRLKRYKRADLVLYALHDLRKEIPGLELVFLGKGEAKDELIKLTKKLHMESWVKFLGYASEEEKLKCLQQAWVTVNTSPREGFGLVILEAASCGTPAIVFDSPGLRESVKPDETGFIVPWGDIKALRAKVKDVLLNPVLRENFSYNAVIWARNFSWDLAAQRTEAFLYWTLKRYYK